VLQKLEAHVVPQRRDGLAGQLDRVLSRAVRAAILASAACTAVLLFGAGLFIGLRDAYGTVVASLIFAGLFLTVAIVALAVRAGARRGKQAQDARIAAQLARWRDGALLGADLLQRKVHRRVAATRRHAAAATRRGLRPAVAALRSSTEFARASIERHPFTVLAVMIATGVLLGAASRAKRR
jgi:hypothetical protein